MEIKLNKVNTLPSTGNKGEIYFDKSTHGIFIADDEGLIKYGGGLK